MTTPSEKIKLQTAEANRRSRKATRRLELRGIYRDTANFGIAYQAEYRRIVAEERTAAKKKLSTARAAKAPAAPKAKAPAYVANTAPHRPAKLTDKRTTIRYQRSKSR